MDAKVESLTKYKMWIGGEWTEAASGEYFESISIRICVF